jgi:hypothetical protein
MQYGRHPEDETTRTMAKVGIALMFAGPRASRPPFFRIPATLAESFAGETPAVRQESRR